MFSLDVWYYFFAFFLWNKIAHKSTRQAEKFLDFFFLRTQLYISASLTGVKSLYNKIVWVLFE